MAFVGVLWLVTGVEWATKSDFGFLGILPRRIEGAIGIFTGPLIHGSASHLFSNTLPLVILGIGLFYIYDRIAFEVFAWIYVSSGFWVWLSAREAYHIGSSGLVYGMVTFLFMVGLLRRDPKSIAVAMIVFLLYGGMIYGLIPGNGDVSWESHLFGALSGVFCAFYYHRYKTRNRVTKVVAALGPHVEPPLSRHNHTLPGGLEMRYVYRKSEEKEKDRRKPSDGPEESGIK
ncbi:hypothetical protein FUAX_21470 [Fulvitalea axinellae]|uniref:Peptidase S54 rhomboid domain-containing protein n=1 Tax=Fulvitalea axinellae TaxID=1182444 RepID=A0AAU9DFG9_9BACT|nr:hypothetical protein FUAX_21470 [Fulvitalea axinellae]